MSQVWKDLQRCPHSGAKRAASYHSSTSKDSKIHYINANSIHTDIYYTSHSTGLKPAWKNARKSKNVPVLPIPPPPNMEDTYISTANNSDGGIHWLSSIFKVTSSQNSPDFPEFDEITKETNTWGCLYFNRTPPPPPPSIGAQPACRAEWVIKLCSQASHPWPSRSQPMGCWTGRGLQGGEIGTRRDVGLPTHQSLRREIVLSLGMGLEQNWELEQCACVHCTCMCVYRLYPPLAWSYTWLACWSHQQSDSREADASSSVTHSGAAD